MVIERALEKMRKTQAAGSKVAAATLQPGVDKERRQSVAHEPRLVFRPEIPLVAIDRAQAAENRLLFPDDQQHTDSHADAAYRMVRTRLLHRMRSHGWHTLAVTSPGAAEGKSLTSLNLAINIAREKLNEVFLLDLDMRNPSICAYLGARPQRELVEYFAGSCQPAEVLFSIGVDKLALAGSVSPTPLASELMASGKFDELIGYVRSIAADPVIVIDLPPLLVTDEALMIAPKVDATILVVTEGRTRRDSLVRARQLLEDFTLAGVIVNRSSESFGVDTYYGYKYRYGKSKV